MYGEELCHTALFEYLFIYIYGEELCYTAIFEYFFIQVNPHGWYQNY